MNIDLKALGLTADAEAAIMGAATATAATKAKPKAQRQKLTTAAWEAAKAGILPPALDIPVSNIHAAKKADAMRKLAQDGDTIALGNIVIGGTNTYAKALRDYLAALLHYLGTAPTPTPAEPEAVLDFTVAKKTVKAKKPKPEPKAAA